MTIALTGHGTLVAYQATPGGAFTTIAELGDVTPPEMSRNEFDATVQNRNIDDYVLGVLRRSGMALPLNFLPTDGTHDHLTGLMQHLKNNTLTGYKITFPDATTWIASGQVQKIAPKAPVDGKLAADVSIRFSGLMLMTGVVIGT